MVLRTLVAVLAFTCLSLVQASPPVGDFEGHGDIGETHLPGSIVYDEPNQVYRVTGAGVNIWGDRDAFHFAWKKVSGDFILQALTAFAGPAVDPHRKIGLMVRATLDPDSPQVNVCRHGEGLMSFQYRRTKGAQTEEVRLAVSGADALQLERRAGHYRMSVAPFGEIYTSRSIEDVDLGDTVYVGIYVCSHNAQVVESAEFRNVRLVRPARQGVVPYREYIGSAVETLEVESGRRLVLHRTQDSIQAPNWTPDGRRLILNHNGRMFSYELGSRSIRGIDTGEQVRNNNDHALSFDGRWLGLSSGQVSTVYVVPIEGGTPRQVTNENPSYLHGWSPDGKYLVYTGIRGDEADIYRIPASGGTEERLTDTQGLDDGSEYTPDGRYIYFNSERSGHMQIWRMRSDGSEEEQVTSDEFNNWFPHLSPDGKWIAFLTYGAHVPSGDHPFYEHVYVRMMPVTGGEPKVVAYVYGGQGSINVNSWAPDSKHLAFVSNGDPQ